MANPALWDKLETSTRNRASRMLLEKHLLTDSLSKSCRPTHKRMILAD